MSGTLVSRHFLRRTARSRAAKLKRADIDRAFLFMVESYVRGPFGWKVVRYLR